MPCFMIGVVALLFGFVAAETAALRHWQGGWRAAALLPLTIVLVVILVIVLDAVRDPTSHNLWPFEICIWCGAGLVALGLLAGARGMTTRNNQP